MSIYHVYSQSYGQWNIKPGSVFVFSANDSKKLVTVWAKYLSVPKRSYRVILENGMVNRLWSFRTWDIEGRYITKLLGQKKKRNCIFKGWHLANGSSDPNNPQNILKEVNKMFQMSLNVLSKLLLILCCHQQKIQKLTQFSHFNDHETLEVNMITRQMTPFFSSTLWVLSFGIFHFCISRTSKLNSMASSLCFMYWPVKYTLTSGPLKLRGWGSCSPPRFLLQLTFYQLTMIVTRKKEPKNINHIKFLENYR